MVDVLWMGQQSHFKQVWRVLNGPHWCFWYHQIYIRCALIIDAQQNDKSWLGGKVRERVLDCHQYQLPTALLKFTHFLVHDIRRLPFFWGVWIHTFKMQWFGNFEKVFAKKLKNQHWCSLFWQKRTRMHCVCHYVILISIKTTDRPTDRFHFCYHLDQKSIWLQQTVT